jgi:hypothetical protein
MRDRQESAPVPETPYSKGVPETPDNKRSSIYKGVSGTGRQDAAPAHGGFTCLKYEPIPNGKRCQHYLPNASCALPDELVCVEWIKRNGHLNAPRTLPASVPAARAAFTRYEPNAPQNRFGAQTELAGLPAGLELAIEHQGQRLFLVQHYSRTPRAELSWDHAATLRLLLESFPGARLVGIGHPSPASEGDPR